MNIRKNMIPKPPQSQRQHYFDSENPLIKREIISMIIQYLDENGFRTSAQILSDEGKFNSAPNSSRVRDLMVLRNSLKSGEWPKIESLQIDKSQPPSFIYQLYRHHFIELLLTGDSQSALLFLSSRLRPYRAFEDPIGDFDSLCLLLVESASPSRSITLPDTEQSLKKILNQIDDSVAQATCEMAERPMERGRLVHLMQQALSSQLSSYPRGSVKSIVNDFVPAILPDSKPINLPTEHTGQVKTIAMVPESETLLTGGSDSTILMWDIKRRMKSGVLKGHHGRIWSVAASTNNIAASGGGDGTIRIWDLSKKEQKAIFENHKSDVYSVDLDVTGKKLISGGFSRSFNVWDVQYEKLLLQQTEHQAAITSVMFDPSGNMAITGGKDLSIKIWDLRNAIVVRTLTPILSEITAVSADRSFTRILGAMKNSTHRIWDIRMSEGILLLKGHQNASKHFVRAHFGPDDRTVLSGSDDGKIYCWGSTTGNILETFNGHTGGVFDVIYSERNECFVSCGNENTVSLWKRKVTQQ